MLVISADFSLFNASSQRSVACIGLRARREAERNINLGCRSLLFFWIVGAVAQSIAPPFEGDDFGALEQPVEDGSGGGDVLADFSRSKRPAV